MQLGRTSVIKIQDHSNVLPELFLADNYVKTYRDPDVEICRTFGNIDYSDMFILFVNREPDIHTAHIDFQYLTELRPNYNFYTNLGGLLSTIGNWH